MLDLMPELDVAAVVRQTGVSGYSRHRPRLETTVRELLGDLPREGLLAPAIARQSHPVTRISDEEISLKDGVTLPGRGLREIFGGATKLVAMVVTIGPALEQRVTAYLDGREALRGLALDAIGNAALDWLCRQGCARVAPGYAARQRRGGSRRAPRSAPVSQTRWTWKFRRSYLNWRGRLQSGFHCLTVASCCRASPCPR